MEIKGKGLLVSSGTKKTRGCRLHAKKNNLQKADGQAVGTL